MTIGLLGPVRVDGGESLEPRDRVALSVLTVRRGAVVSPDQFAEALWADRLPSSWPKQIQICVGRLRKVLGVDAIETVSGGYRLAVDAFEVDVVRFEQLIERGRVLMADGEPDRAAVALARALALWRGRPLDELDSWLPARSEAARLEELRRIAEEDWLEARLAAGEHRAVAAEAEALVTAEPLRERRWAILALARYRCGRQGDALRSLSSARQTLVDQLGLDPGPELVALEAAILRQDGVLSVVAGPAPASDACPYKGLAHYDVGDGDTFFGRDAEVSACVERLRATSLLVVAGPSGCGKSSLVRAGIVPVLEQRGQSAVVFVPGRDPQAALLDATSTAAAPVVLVIDQFEELFTLGTPTEVVRTFLEFLAQYARDRASVVIAVRSDQLGGLSLAPALSQLAERGLHLITPLAGSDLREAIEQPAAIAGIRLEPGLVDLLVRESEGEPGALPLLSHSLVETWQRRDGNVLTVQGYRATGGIRGAVARSADRLYESLALEQRAMLRSVLLRLVAPSVDGEPVRCRVGSRVLLGDPGRERVVALLVRSRLVTSEADAFELAHEALAKAWPRLRSWLDEDAAGQRILRHLGVAADGWESLGRPDSELYRGARLEAATEWSAVARPDLTALERDFLAASTDRATSESRTLAERSRRDARQNRRLRGLLAATAVLLVGALVAGLLAINSRQDVRRQRDTADGERRIATARELAAAATANLSVDAERSVLLALAAVDETRSADGTVLPEATEALHRAVTASRVQLRVTGVGGDVDWNPDGVTFVTEGAESSGRIDIRDARTGESVRSFRGHDVDVTGVAFNHDGTMLGTTGQDGAARVWDPTTGRLVHELERAGGTGAWSPTFSPDGTLFAAAWPDEDLVVVLDLASGDVVREIRSVAAPESVSFDPAGARLAVASSVEPISVVVDLSSGDPLLTLEGHLHLLEDVAWSPDGASIATGSADASVRVFDAATGRQRFALLAHGSHIRDVDWSPDSGRLVTASADGTAKVWLLLEGDGREYATLSAQDTRAGIIGATFSPDGARVLTGDASNTATIWDVGISAGAEVAAVPAVAFHYSTAEFTPGGGHLLATGGARSINVWASDTFSRVRSLGAPAQPISLAFGTQPIGGDDAMRIQISPDGELVAAALQHERHDGVVHVWDLETGQETIATRTGWPVNDIAWSPDSAHLAIAGSGNGSGSVAVVDRAGQQVTASGHAESWINSIAFSPDGQRLITSIGALGGDEPTASRVEIWDWNTEVVDVIIETEAAVAVPSPSGDLIATAPNPEATSQAVGIWNASTGERVASLAGHTGAVVDLTFDTDGARLATASADGTIRLWDPRTGQQLLVLHLSVLVTSVSFSPDGTQLATASADGVVRVWALELDDLIAIAEHKVTRRPTDDECDRYPSIRSCPQTQTD